MLYLITYIVVIGELKVIRAPFKLFPDKSLYQHINQDSYYLKG